MTIQLKASENYFLEVLFTYKVVLTFEFVVEILKCVHSNESYWAVLSCGAVYYAVKGGSNFWVCGWNPTVWPFTWKLLSSTLLCSLRRRRFGVGCFSEGNSREAKIFNEMAVQKLDQGETRRWVRRRRRKGNCLHSAPWDFWNAPSSRVWLAFAVNVNRQPITACLT